MEESDLCFQPQHCAKYWGSRFEQAKAAETTHSLSPEERDDYKRKLIDARIATQTAMYAANAMSVIAWEALSEEEEFHPDALYFWQNELKRYQQIAKRRTQTRRAASPSTVTI
jgi:hypothetical protein